MGRIFVFNPERHIGDIKLLRVLSSYLGHEVTRIKLSKDQEYEFTHDKQTRCLNRNSYINYVKSKKSVNSIGYISVDVNATRSITDMFGNDYADQVILRFVEDMRRIFPDQLIYRLGYDNFIIICENMEQLHFNTYAGRLRDLMMVGEFTASCAYVWNDFEIDVRAMEDHAFNLLYAEKQKWHEEQDSMSNKWNNITAEIVKEEIAKGFFSVTYQPKVFYPKGDFYGAECLVRYSGNDNLGDVINRLEKSNTIKYVDLYVLETVCKDMAGWRENGYDLIPISCNFSRISLQEDGIVDMITEIVDSYSIPHELIEIEITESISELEHDSLKKIAESIHGKGFKIAMDDFGTKYSNVAVLASLRFDEIKFDRSMVYDIDTNPVTEKVVKHLLSMCSDLGIFYLAEGVETVQQAEKLRSLGCTCMQGFLYSKPEKADTFIQIYRASLDL